MAKLSDKNEILLPSDDYPGGDQTGFTSSIIGSNSQTIAEREMNSGTHGSKIGGPFAGAKTFYNEEREFVKLVKAFSTALDDEKKEKFGNDGFKATEAMKMSASLLLQCRPDKISVQLTEDGSIFYTLIIDNLTIYFEHYPMSDLDDLDEVVLTIYNEKENILNVSGEMHEVIAAANGILRKHNIAMPELA